MSNTIQILESAAGSTGAKASVDLGGKTPFEVGKPITISMFSTGSGTAPQYDVEGSDDDSTWELLGSIDTVGLTTASVTCRRYLRVNVDTAAGTAGLISAIATATK